MQNNFGKVTLGTRRGLTAAA